MMIKKKIDDEIAYSLYYGQQAKRYSLHRCKTLVYFEVGGSMEGAIFREKQIKAASRTDKIDLIESMNPEWIGLYESIT
jgi:predicted GIY-YIG superfamily endonuclease